MRVGLDVTRAPASKWAPAASALVAVLAAAFLVSGSDCLDFLLPGGLPIGNAVAAAIPCGIAGTAALLAPRGTGSRTVAVIALAASIAWLPLSIALSGNLSLNFSGLRGVVWAWFPAAVFVLALAAVLMACVANFRARGSRNPSP